MSRWNQDDWDYMMFPFIIGEKQLDRMIEKMMEDLLEDLKEDYDGR